MGEYNVSKNTNTKVLHLEVFTKDDIKSFLEKLENLIIPKLQKNGAKLNSSYEELFKLIDNDNNKELDQQEIKDAAKNEIIKITTSNYIVKHSSEWDITTNMADVLLEISSKYKNELDEEDINREKERIKKLSFFSECKSITDFPQSDEVFHLNAIGLVGAFDKGCVITKEMLNIVAPDKDNDAELLEYLNTYAEIYDVNTENRIAHFLSQIAHESGFNNIEENLNYRPTTMRKIFGCKGGSNQYDKNTDDCELGRLREKLWTEESKYANNPENLANYVYSRENLGNGNELSGDGYKYRGRGMMQLTGKNNYQIFTNKHNIKNPNDIQDFVINPNLIISDKKYGVESAFIFWDNRNINLIADDTNVKAITIKVNGGINGLLDRQEKFNNLIKIMN